MKVTLIRHTSVDVPQGTCYGQTDVPVKSSFSEEAALVKSNLATYLPFDKVYCSPLTRAVKLASYCGFPDASVMSASWS
jgi:alpha-ribazole phosphatase